MDIVRHNSEAWDHEVEKNNKWTIPVTSEEVADARPVSNCFVDQVEPVWRECFRVLKQGGTLLAGFVNPIEYIFDLDEMDNHANLVVRYKIPFADVEQLPEDQLQNRIKNKETLEYGHSLDAQIGGQLKAGFVLTGFFEDTADHDLLSQYIPSFMATRALKMRSR